MATESNLFVIRCKRCKRILKNPRSIINGYGSICWKKVQKSELDLTHQHNPTLVDVFKKDHINIIKTMDGQNHDK